MISEKTPVQETKIDMQKQELDETISEPKFNGKYLTTQSFQNYYKSI